MFAPTTEINNKSVRLCRPYVAPLTPMVGRESEMLKILAVWIVGEDFFPLSPLLLGDPASARIASSMSAPACAPKSSTCARGTKNFRPRTWSAPCVSATTPPRRWTTVVTAPRSSHLGCHTAPRANPKNRGNRNINLTIALTIKPIDSDKYNPLNGLTPYQTSG
jgi:hypothetical protein